MFVLNEITERIDLLHCPQHCVIRNNTERNFKICIKQRVPVATKY